MTRKGVLYLSKDAYFSDSTTTFGMSVFQGTVGKDTGEKGKQLYPSEANAAERDQNFR